jgi:Domain of unknown function (DUF4132)
VVLDVIEGAVAVALVQADHARSFHDGLSERSAWMRSMPQTIDDRVWVAVGEGYELTLAGSSLVCRNDKGRELKSVPKKVKESPEAEDLLALRDWLARHEAECRSTVESWMLGSFPVPAKIIAEVWPDPAWRTQLENLVVTGDVVGLLRGVDELGSLGIVDLDGETEWLKPSSVVIPHPVLLGDDLDDLREFAAELGIAQAVPQLAREVFRVPDDRAGDATAIRSYADGVFKELRHATARANRYGYQVRGGYAVCRAYDAGVPVQARYWLGGDDPNYETWTGDLIWTDADERSLKLAEIGPVAWSEGIRMAELIYSGRHVEESEEA